MKRALAAMALGLGLAGGAAHAALIDFTDSTVWNDPSDTQTVDLGLYSTTVSLNAVPNAPTFTPYDGPNPVVEPLADSGLYVVDNPDTANDGIGVAPSDEITNPDDRLFVSFSEPVLVTGFHFLDLFRPADQDSPEFEVVEIFFDGDLVFTFEVGAEEDYEFARSGYFFADIAARRASRVSFAAGLGNDNVGRPDFALAGIEVAPIPVPAAGFLLIGALGGIGALRLRRRA